MELTKLNLETTVNNAFLNCRGEMLPKEMRNSRLTEWILDFDRLEKQRENRSRNSSEQDSFEFLISNIVQESLTPNITFYYASLFHIGRQWKVSELALENAEKALDPYNLKESISLNTDIFSKELKEMVTSDFEYESLISESLVVILEASIRQHFEKIENAKSLWHEWTREVGKLKEIVDESSRNFGGYNNYRHNDYRELRYLFPLISFSFKRNHLFYKLKEDGIEFAESSSIQPFSYFQLLLPIIVNGDFGHFEHIIHEVRNLLHEENKRLENERWLPIIRNIEEKLLRRFKRINPFDKYGLLKSPPDEQLKYLWEKCKLPNGQMFFYAEHWKDSLKSMTIYYYNLLPYKKTFEYEDIANFAKSADSIIKNAWVNKHSTSGQTAKEFIQITFENEWIIPLSFMALKPTRDAKITEQEWDLASFQKLLNKTVSVLNKSGYDLYVPSYERLNKLWKQASDKDANTYYTKF